jgi:exonuclease VII small subunit
MDKNKLEDSLKKPEEIIEWFDKQEEVDVEAGLERVKEGVALIKTSRERLQKLESEFKEAKKELEEEIEPGNE